MRKKSKYKLAEIAIKFGVGIDTLADILKEKGYHEIKDNPNQILTAEQYDYLNESFFGNLELKNKVNELRTQEMTDKIISLLPMVVEILKLSRKIRSNSHYRFPWRANEIEKLVKLYFDSFPKDILENIKNNNLSEKDLFEEIDTFINKENTKSKINKKEKIEESYLGSDNDNYIDIGRFCSACQQAPCMCSDPERSSTTFWS